MRVTLLVDFTVGEGWSCLVTHNGEVIHHTQPMYTRGQAVALASDWILDHGYFLESVRHSRDGELVGI